MTDTPTREPLVGLAERLREVTQADRDAAAAMLERCQAGLWRDAGIVADGNDDGHRFVQAFALHRATALEEQSRRVEELTVALTAIVDGDVPRTVGRHWRDDEKPSKNDQCVHGAWMYDDCGECIADFARTALSPFNTVEKP